MYLVTDDNLYEAQDALRDIIYMYFNMIEHQNGFFHATDTGSFDPFIYLDAENHPTSGQLMPADINLLHAGSALAILCGLYDIWNEHENLQIPYADRVQKAVLDGRFSHLPDIEALLRELFERNIDWQDFWLHEALPPVYSKYVVGFFKQLLVNKFL
ncbi:hypothetical protein Q0M94_05735 [Deinococcus radiomollis]|uniref:hypothetical protein n=1 Tax=Deinococcus radiomollis TaxID=468916 RepID=UPI0038917B61